MGLNLQGPRNAASRMATYVNRRPIYLGGGVVILIILGTAVALDHSGQNSVQPVKVTPEKNSELVHAQQIALQSAARERTIAASAATASGTASAALNESAPREVAQSSSLPPEQAAITAAPQQPQQPSPKIAAIENALTAGWGNQESSLGLHAPKVPNDQEALAQAEQSAKAVAGAGQKAPASLAEYNAHLLRRPMSPYEIMAGSVIPAVLETGIDSDLPGMITAIVSQNVYASTSGAYLLIPAGAKIVGSYASSPKMGQDRVFVAWTQLVFPNGSAMNLGGFPGDSPRGYAGFHDLVDDHTWSMFKNALLISLIQTGVSLSQPGYGSVGVSGSQAISPSQVAEQNLANTFGQAEAQMLQSAANVSPTIKIRPGYTFGVLVPKTLLFPSPYQSAVAAAAADPMKVAEPPIANPYLTGSFPQGGSGGSGVGLSPGMLSTLKNFLHQPGLPEGQGQGTPNGQSPLSGPVSGEMP